MAFSVLLIYIPDSAASWLLLTIWMFARSQLTVRFSLCVYIYITINSLNWLCFENWRILVTSAISITNSISDYTSSSYWYLSGWQMSIYLLNISRLKIWQVKKLKLSWTWRIISINQNILKKCDTINRFTNKKYLLP